MNVRKKDLTSALFILRKDVVGSRHRAWENMWSVQAPVLELTVSFRSKLQFFLTPIKLMLPFIRLISLHAMAPESKDSEKT